MGCTTSKRARRDIGRRTHSPLPRSRSLSFRRRISDSGGGGDHIVSLTSSTLGILELDVGPGGDEDDRECADGGGGDAPAAVLVKARIWSEKVAKKMPRTPTVTPPNEPETIDALELMAGLEASTPPRPSAGYLDRYSFSFCPMTDGGEGVHSKQSTAISNESEFDPEILSAFRKALAEIPPQHPSPLRSPEPTTVFKGIVQARVREFQRRIDAKKANTNAQAARGANAAEASQPESCPPEGEAKVIVYFTSIRGVRKTYEDCCLVRSMLKGCGVRVDERDVSMDRGFREEIKKLLGAERAASLPRVFANGRYVGGVEEMKQLHEAGELQKVVENCQAAAGKDGDRGGPCERCGDVRFVLCGRCSGSCKLHPESGNGGQSRGADGPENAVAGSGLWRCPECNENGLLRCPWCCC